MGGHLRVSVDYDTVGIPPAPGDQVLLLSLASPLDLFPLPIWPKGCEPSLGPMAVWGAQGGGRRGWCRGKGGFRVEEVGDDFYLVSYASGEGWRCIVEIHRFLVSVVKRRVVMCLAGGC
ncbi:unnamed protein product [Discosporangium mesarthrocarpum]